MIEKYIELKRKQSSLLDQYPKASKEEKMIIKKEYEKIDDQMEEIYKTLPKGIKKQI